MRTDQAFWLEMTFCNEHGIAHSEFLSWEHEDQAKAMAFMMEKSLRCVMCGSADWEWQQNRYAYEPVVKLCRGCEVKDSTAEAMERRPGQTVELAPGVGPEAARRRVVEKQRYLHQRASKEQRSAKRREEAAASTVTKVRAAVSMGEPAMGAGL